MSLYFDIINIRTRLLQGWKDSDASSLRLLSSHDSFVITSEATTVDYVWAGIRTISPRTIPPRTISPPGQHPLGQYPPGQYPPWTISPWDNIPPRQYPSVRVRIRVKVRFRVQSINQSMSLFSPTTINYLHRNIT